MNRGPIYLAGADRSGTTLMYALLASHSHIAMANLGSNMWTFFYGQHGDLSRRQNFERCLAALLRYKNALLLEPIRSVSDGILAGRTVLCPPFWRCSRSILQNARASRAGRQDQLCGTIRRSDFRGLSGCWDDSSDSRSTRRYASAIKRWGAQEDE